MLRKLISKIRQSFTKEEKRPDPKPAHKSGKPTPKPGEYRHERRGGGHTPKPAGSGRHPAPIHSQPRPTQRAPEGRPVQHAQPPRPAAHIPRASHPPKPLPEVPKMDTPFTALGLNDRLAFAVQEMGYTIPTPIQVQGIPAVLANRDVIGSAQTGTGKTAAFALPILQRLASHGSMRCLILEPTRELAVQVEEAFKNFAKFTDLRITVVYGGVGYGKQREDLAHGMDVLAATPGRLLDFMEQGEVRLDHIDILVLDEVDRMLDMGFLPDVKRIVAKVPRTRQTLFFTATLPP